MIEIICGIVGIGALFCVAVIIADTHRFVVKETVLHSEKVKQDTTFVVLADLHNKSFGKGNTRLLEKIREAHPDMILLAGDMLNAKPGADFDETAEFIKKLADEYPVLYGIGNHEHRLELYPDVYGTMYEEYWSALKHENIVPLVNAHVEFSKRGICVFGAQIDKRFYKRFKIQQMEQGYLTGLLGEPKKELFTVLLAHNPDYFESYAAWGADLVLSGHVHGGIVRLPFLGGVLSPACRLFPKYDGGLYEREKSTMLLSRGLGSHTIPVRMLNPGELHVVTLKREADSF